MHTEEYDRMFRHEGDYWWFVGRRRLVFTLIDEWARSLKHARILDVGCGTGAMAKELQRYGEVVACDLSHLSLEYCKKRCLEELVCGDIACLPFQDQSFDLIVALDILEHVPDDKAAMRELRRVLKPNGRLVVTVPAYRFLWSNHDVALMHCRRYTARELKRKLIEAGFRVRKLSYAMTILFPLVASFRLLSKWKDKNKPPEASILPVSPKVNRWLERLQQFESRIVRRMNLPFGVTVVAVLEP